ncbi:hyalin-like [Patiria miniata]|uniref:HYR domain-containing protein n=1 Tax=Patiria miniata TaxID=46514 RepID=A0A914B5W1_PATMI|nr:hyalin-like [Patiria miniata]
MTGWLSVSQADFCNPSSVTRYYCISDLLEDWAEFDPAVVNASARTPCALIDGAPPTIDSCIDVRTNKALVSDIISGLDVTATDNVNNSVPIHCVETRGAIHLTTNETIFNCTASDTAGGEATCTFNVVLDQQAPVIDNCPSNVRTNNAVVTWTPDPTANDNDGTTLEVTCIPTAGSSFLVDATTIVVCNAIDVAGNEAILCTFNVTVDQQAPVIDNCPSNVRTNNAMVTWTPDPTATDNDGTTLEVTCIPTAGSSFPVDATTIVVCNASDVAGNEAICTFNVTVDQQTPVIDNCPSYVRTNNVVVTWTPDPTATDNDGTTLEVTCIPTAGSSFLVDATTIVVCNASDVAGNEAICTFNVTVDQQTPVIDNCPSNVRTNNAMVTWTPDPTATDNDGTTPAVTCTPTAGSLFPVDATTIVVCNASDVAGNETICTFNVTVDQQVPVIDNCPSYVMTNNVVVTWTPDPTATDNDGTTPAVTCTPTAGSSFPVDATTIVVCNASDVAGNEAICTFNVTVDQQAPVIDNCPSNVRTNNAVVTWTPDPTATDNDGATPEVICTPTAGSSFPVDASTIVVCNATDAVGNEAFICTFNVTVDQQAPVIDNCPSNVRTNNAMVTWTPDPTATDNDGTTPAVTCTPTAGSLFPVDATTIVVCNASDVAGNEAICTFNVTVDQQVPVINNCPSNVRTNNAVVTWTPDPTATDNDGTTPAVTCTPTAGSSFPVDDSTTVVCTARDTAGNEASCTFRVTVDQQAPAIDDCPSDVRTNNVMVTWTPDPTATDNDGTSPAVTCIPAAGSSFPVDVRTTVVCTARDTAGNEAGCNFSVTVDPEVVVVSMAINETNGSDVPFIDAYNDVTSPESRELCLPVETAMLEALSPEMASIATAKCIAIYQGSIIVDVRLGFSPDPNSAPLSGAVQGVLQNVITEGTFGAGGSVTYTINPESVVAQCTTSLAAVLIPVIALVCLLVVIGVCIFLMRSAAYEASEQPAAPPELNLMAYDRGAHPPQRLYNPYHGKLTHESRFTRLGGRLAVNRLAYINRQETF